MRCSGPMRGGEKVVCGTRARCDRRGSRAQAEIKAKEEAEDKEKADKAQAEADKEAGAGGRTLAQRIAGLFDLPQARAPGPAAPRPCAACTTAAGLEPLLVRRLRGWRSAAPQVHCC